LGANIRQLETHLLIFGMKHFDLFYFGRKSGERKCLNNSSDIALLYQKEMKAHLTISFALSTPAQCSVGIVLLA